MAKLGKCCCGGVTCCGPLVVPSGWTLISDCCAQKITNITEGWTNVCSASARTDTRTASVDYKVYKTPYPDWDETDLGSITCVTDPMTGIETCTGTGGDLPPCSDEVEVLCNTISQERTVTTESRIAARYKRIRQIDTLSRVETACDGGASSCKWLLISRIEYLIEALQMDFITDAFTQTDTATDACCGDNPTTIFIEDTCNEMADALAGNGSRTVILCRSKYFTSAPSGTIVFNPGDIVDCTPMTGPCTTLCQDELDICTTDPGTITWDDPACIPYTDTIPCLVYVHYIDLDDNPQCAPYPNGDLITISGVTIQGELLGVYGAVPIAGTYLCPPNCAVRPSNYYINRVICDGLTSSQTDSGYTERCITISPSTWSITL